MLIWSDVDRFLSHYDREPGVAQVRSRFCEMADLADRAPLRPTNTPRCGYLEVALQAITAPGSVDLVGVLAEARLHWESYDAYASETIGPRFPQRHAYASLMAGLDPDWSRDFDIGFLLIAPHTLYRDHHHLASELYLPLTGPTYWRFGTGFPWREEKAGSVVWNPPNQPHATLVRDVPLLALYAWTENVKSPAVVDPAADWVAIEAELTGG